MTIAVWVGYPDKLTPMKTEFDGEPVAGGTFPAQIWHDFVVQAGAIFKQRIADRQAKRDGKAAPDATDPSATLDTPVTGGSAAAAARHGTDGKSGGTGGTGKTSTGGNGGDGGGTAEADARARPDAHARPRRRPRRRPPRRRPTAAAPAAPRPAASARRRAERRASRPGGHGRDTQRLPAAQKRQGRSTARVIPMRGPTRIAGAGASAAAASIRTGPSTRLVPLRSSPIAERLRELAGARAEVLEPVAPAARAHLVARPSSGSSARISTAAPVRSSSQTAFSSAWTPYER